MCVERFVSEETFERVKAIELEGCWIEPDECDTPEQLDKKLKSIVEGRQ